MFGYDFTNKSKITYPPLTMQINDKKWLPIHHFYKYFLPTFQEIHLDMEIPLKIGNHKTYVVVQHYKKYV